MTNETGVRRVAVGRRFATWLSGIVALLVASRGIAVAAEVETAKGPIGQYITLKSPVTDDSIGTVRRQALALQERATRESRPAVLILEITPGQSQFHHVYALADFLTSPALSNVRTVAWAPGSVSGNNVLIALACREIVMTADSRLGDIGEGAALPEEQQKFLLAVVSRQQNPKVRPALARAMADPSTKLLQLTVEGPGGERERRVATPEEAADLQASGIAVPESRVLKEAGLVGSFSGEQARGGDFLVRHVIAQRGELAGLYRLPSESLREAAAPNRAEHVSLIEVKGSIDRLLESFLNRQISRAVEGGAELIIFEIESPGGHVEDVAILAKAIAALADAHVRTVAWVPHMATGEAAIVALGCDEIYLTPQSKIGGISRRRKFDVEKLQSGDEEQKFLLESLASLAEKKRRPVGIVQAMASPKLQVFQATNRQTGAVSYLSDEQLDQQGEEWIRGPLVPESGQGLLTLTGDRARELMIAEAPVADFDELKSRLGLAPKTIPVRVERTWVDDFVFSLNTPFMTGLLFTLALICIYLELHFMTGVLGIIATVCFALFFWSRFLGGTAGSLEVVLFLIGMGCLALELFVIPGFGVFGVAGGLLVLASLVMASQTFGNLETGRDLTEATGTLTTISGSIVTVIVLAAVLSRFLPRMPFLNEMVLAPPGAREDGDFEPRLRRDVAGESPGLIGTRGVAETPLRPAGKAKLQGRMMDVVSNGPFIESGTAIEVVSAAGNHVVVRAT